VNTAILCILLAIFGQTGSKYNHHALDAVWRISFGLGLIPVTAMLIYRLFFLQESKVWVRHSKPASVRQQCSSCLSYTITALPQVLGKLFLCASIGAHAKLPDMQSFFIFSTYVLSQVLKA